MQHQIMMQQFDALQLSGAMHSLSACKSLSAYKSLAPCTRWHLMHCQSADCLNLVLPFGGTRFP